MVVDVIVPFLFEWGSSKQPLLCCFSPIIQLAEGQENIALNIHKYMT